MNSENVQQLDNKDRCFKGQQKTEETICFFRKHWIVLIRHILVFLLLCIGLFLLIFYIINNNVKDFSSEIKLLTVFVLVFVSYFFHRFFVALHNYYLTMVIITNYRIIELYKTLILHDDKNVIDLQEIQDIQKIQNGFVQSVLDYGTIKILLSGVQETITFDFVPNPDRYFRRINVAKREYLLKQEQINTKF